MNKFLLALCLFMLPFSSNALLSPLIVQEMLIQPATTATSFTFVISNKIYPKVTQIENPNRVIVEFTNARMNMHMQNAHLGDSFVNTVDTKQTNDGNLQIIFSVNTKAKWDMHFLESQKDKRARLIIKISPVK